MKNTSKLANEAKKNQELLPIDEEIKAKRKSAVEIIIKPDKRTENVIDNHIIFISKEI